MSPVLMFQAHDSAASGFCFFSNTSVSSLSNFHVDLQTITSSKLSGENKRQHENLEFVPTNSFPKRDDATGTSNLPSLGIFAFAISKSCCWNLVESIAEVGSRRQIILWRGGLKILEDFILHFSCDFLPTTYYDCDALRTEGIKHWCL